jgi:hypothetical protein
MAEKQVIVRYHYEDGSWWADSQDLPSLFAGGDSLEEARELVRQVVDDELGADTTIVAWMPVPEPLAQVVSVGGAGSKEFSWSGRTPELWEILGGDKDPEHTANPVRA